MKAAWFSNTRECTTVNNYCADAAFFVGAAIALA